MKNQFIGLLAICFVLTSCTKQELVAPAVNLVNVNLLARDSNFLEIIEQEKQLTHFISQLANEKGLTIVELKNKLQDLHNKDLNSGSGNQILYAYVGTKYINLIKDLANIYRINYNHVSKRYGPLTIMQVDTAVKQVYKNEYRLSLGNTRSVDMIATNALLEVNKVNDCGWKYALCMAAATAGAIGCHVACIASTAGFGTPGCVLLCGTIQAAAGVICIDNYCPIPE